MQAKAEVIILMAVIDLKGSQTLRFNMNETG
jgi:hypothetical protein